MDSFKKLHDTGRLGLTVYSPDCQRSRLAGALDQAIHTATGFQPVFRFWIKHDINSVRRFYADGDAEPAPDDDPDQARQRYARIPPQDLQYGHLVVRLLMSGPSLLTLWRGEEAIPSIMTLKGVTQPAEASPDSIRGRFWCDNGVCNLIHSSDSDRELRRELAAVNAPFDWAGEAHPLPLIDPAPPPESYIAHCGLAVTLDIANRLLIAAGEAPLTVALPDHGRAADTHHILSAALHGLGKRWPESRAGRLTAAVLSGDLVALDTLASELPATDWEYMVIQCATITQDSWRKKEIDSA